MSKKTKNVEIDGLGPITLSALGVGWMEDCADEVLAKITGATSTKERMGAAMLMIHASTSKLHPDISLEKLKDVVIVPEMKALTEDIMELSGLSAPGGAKPENPSQESSSAS